MQHAISPTAWVDDFLKLSTSEMVRENQHLIDDLKRRITALEEKFCITKKAVKVSHGNDNVVLEGSRNVVS